MALTDGVSTIKTLLDNNWNRANTDNIKPTVFIKEERKSVDTSSTRSEIAIYERLVQYISNGLGVSTRQRKNKVAVEVFTSKSRSHFINLRKEADRILNANIKNPDANFQILNPDGEFVQLENYVNHWRGVLEIELWKTNEAR